MLELYQMNDILSLNQVDKNYQQKSKSFDRGTNVLFKAVEQLSISLGQGETLGLAGESGCGKSTVAKLLTGLIQPDQGSVNFIGKDIKNLGQAEYKIFRRAVQMIFQDPFSSLNPRMRIGDTIAEPLHIHNLCDKSTLREKALEIMENVGLDYELYDRFPHEFSGGQRQRIGIARALAAEPTVLIADEPVSSLDISIQAQIINLLQELKKKNGLSMLMVSHDLGVLRHTCDRIAVMYLGRLVEVASSEEIFSKSRHPYTRALLAAMPHIMKRDGLKSVSLSLSDINEYHSRTDGCHFQSRCRYAEARCKIEKPSLIACSPGHTVACHLALNLPISD